MAFSLSDKIGAGRIKADPGSGWRSNAADISAGNADSGSSGRGGGWNSEQNPSADQSQSMLSSAPAGNPHSSSGFRRALEKTQRGVGKLSGAIASKTDFGGKGFRKPNYFGQGGRRQGLHLGSGAPVIQPAQDAGSGSGGE